MRFLFLALPLICLTSCSSTSTSSAQAEAQRAAKDTDECLATPEAAREWGTCNVKHTLYLASEDLSRCRKAYPSAKGEVMFELKVQANGKVKSAQLSGMKHGKLGSCLTKVMKKLEFAPTSSGKEATISVPYQLEP